MEEVQLPQKISLANIPTPIFELKNLNPDMDWATLYIKRDDFTGFETSGNKVRKFEYHIHRARELDSNMLITCGGLQSNHARTAAALAAKFSWGCHLVLREPSGPVELPDSNYLLDCLFGASFDMITKEEYANNRDWYMQEACKRYRNEGKSPYVIPEGGSDECGVFGYFDAYKEILQQERAMGLRFDAICVADGSAGTYCGLYLANEVLGGKKQIVGFNVYGIDDTFGKHISILKAASRVLGLPPVSEERIYVNPDYLGTGYGEVSRELIDFIKHAAKTTGIVFDPVYTGKAMMGTVGEIAKHNPRLRGNVLFIHTGGQFGLFPYRKFFD